MNWRKKWRAIKYKIVKTILTDEEKKVLFGVRMGYLPQDETATVSFTFTLDGASYAFLHSADGSREFDAKRGAARQLLRAREEELADLITYTERQDEETGFWFCTSRIEVVRR